MGWQILDEIYFENYKKEKEAEERRAEEERRASEGAQGEEVCDGVRLSECSAW